MPNRLTLTRASKSHDGTRDPDDYAVRNAAGRVVGRIVRHPQARKGHEWLWMISAREIKPSTANRGYAATRDKAMAEFKAWWLSELK